MAEATVYLTKEGREALQNTPGSTGATKRIQNVLAPPVALPNGRWQVIANPHQYFFDKGTVALIEIEGEFGRQSEREMAGQSGQAQGAQNR